MESLRHDVAWETSQRILELMAPCLCEETQRELLAEIYRRITIGLECFEIQTNRMRKLKPSRN